MNLKIRQLKLTCPRCTEKNEWSSKHVYTRRGVSLHSFYHILLTGTFAFPSSFFFQSECRDNAGFMGSWSVHFHRVLCLGLMAGLMFCFCHLQVFSNFWTRDSASYIAVTEYNLCGCLLVYYCLLFLDWKLYSGQSCAYFIHQVLTIVPGTELADSVFLKWMNKPALSQFSYM